MERVASGAGRGSSSKDPSSTTYSVRAGIDGLGNLEENNWTSVLPIYLSISPCYR